MSCVEKLHDFSILILFLTVVVVALCAWMDRSASALLLGWCTAPCAPPDATNHLGKILDTDFLSFEAGLLTTTQVCTISLYTVAFQIAEL